MDCKKHEMVIVTRTITTTFKDGDYIESVIVETLKCNKCGEMDIKTYRGNIKKDGYVAE